MNFRRLHNPGVPVALRLGSLDLVAFSISGLATYVLVPAFDAAFDLGHCALEATRLRHVFLSHVHQDHSGGVHRHLAVRQMVGAPAPRIHCPAESAAALRDLLRAWERLEERAPADLDAVVCPVAAGDRLPLGRRYTVEAFDVTHRIASRGYTVHERQRVPREAFRDLSGAARAAARARGECVEDLVERPVFTYVGDSTVETLRRRPQLGRSDVLFLEVTHLPGTRREVSESWGHTHLDDVVELAREGHAALASPHVVLKHFSMRYDERAIRAALERLPPELRARVTLLV